MILFTRALYQTSTIYNVAKANAPETSDLTDNMYISDFLFFVYDDFCKMFRDLFGMMNFDQYVRKNFFLYTAHEFVRNGRKVFVVVVCCCVFY